MNWHHRLLMTTLDEWIDKKIRKLIVTMPPRHGKSEGVSRRLPAYIFGLHPDARVIATSYGFELATSMNRDVQRIIDSDEYRALFPDTQLFGKNIRAPAELAYLRNSDIFEIVGHRGYYLCSGVGGAITGRGFDFGIIDDPIKNDEEAYSATYRDKVWNWYCGTFLTRAETDASILITQTRWHQDDLTGRLLKHEPGQWTVLNIPAQLEAEDTRHEADPRAVGDPLWPEKKSKAELAQIRHTIGNRKWYAMYGQKPVAEGGTLFRDSMFRYAESQVLCHEDQERKGEVADILITLHVPTGAEGQDRRILASACWWFQTADTALKTGQDNDNTAIGTWLVTPEFDLILWEVFCDKVEVPKQYDLLMAQRQKHPRLMFQAIEEAASGIGLIQLGAQRGTPFRALSTRGGDKMQRAMPMLTLYENGKVYHRITDSDAWLPGYENELKSFPAAAHDDRVDMAAHAGALVVRGDIAFSMSLGRELLVYPTAPEAASDEEIEEAERREAAGPEIDEEPEWWE